jgi:pimeloyl-ACP methyl ester carboxylesterase
LVPGFFGFTSVGGLEYFRGVQTTLEKHCSDFGIHAKVHQVATLPTASIRQRAAQVLDALVAIAAEDDRPIHIVGHSTGGLDARLAIAPTASLPSRQKFHAYDRVKSLVTVATPHYGTPLASVIGGAMGKPLLRLIAVVAVLALRRGRLPLALAFKAGNLWNRSNRLLGMQNSIMDQLYADLLSDFSTERQQQVIELIRQVSADQSLIFQLTAAGCDLLNAGTGDPEGVRYGCVVTRARPFGVGGFIANRHNVYAHTFHAAFGASYLVLSRASKQYAAPLDDVQRATLTRAYGRALGPGDNDGIVPSLSQVWGPVIHAAQADHLDVIGHFGPTPNGAQRADFISSASGFDESSFDVLWREVSRFLCEAPAGRT